MNRRNIDRFRFAAPGLALVWLAGCPQGGELENPALYAAAGATAGTSSTAGSGSSGSGGTPRVVIGVDCDWQTGLNRSCATTSCHTARERWGGLDLTPDDGLVDRLKDVVATNSDIDCNPMGTYMRCETPPAECSPYLSAKLVDSANPDASYILTKMSAPDCGNQMPMSPGNSPNFGWGDERKACLEQLVRAIAAMP